MKTSPCICGNILFFDSLQCLQCEREVGICAACLEATPLTGKATGQCIHCEATIHACGNRRSHGVCNVWVDDRATPASDLCPHCRLTTVVPDLSVPGNAERWRLLEAAKRRVLISAETAGFPAASDLQSTELPLRFEFMADTAETSVTTGHCHGCITINVKEADSVERERRRVEFDEPRRTLVGHIRHELGHYAWEMWVKRRHLSEFREVFGHEAQPEYLTAKKQYYSESAQRNWRGEFVSEYASMHPWEDFAESFATVLDMIAVLSTVTHFAEHPQITGLRPGADFDKLLSAYQRIGTIANEVNRDVGLLDVVPEVLSSSIIHKLRFVHRVAIQRSSTAHEI